MSKLDLNCNSLRLQILQRAFNHARTQRSPAKAGGEKGRRPF